MVKPCRTCRSTRLSSIGWIAPLGSTFAVKGPKREAHLPTQHPPQGKEARIPGSYVHPCRPCRPEVSSPQGPSPHQRLVPLSGQLVGSVQRRALFDALRRPRGRASRGPIRVSYTTGDHGSVLTRPHVAYAIDKTCGNAVQRNQLRRRLRVLSTEASVKMAPGAYLVRTQPAASSLSFHELRTLVVPTLIEAGERGGR